MKGIQTIEKINDSWKTVLETYNKERDEFLMHQVKYNNITIRIEKKLMHKTGDFRYWEISIIYYGLSIFKTHFDDEMEINRIKYNALCLFNDLVNELTFANRKFFSWLVL